MQHTLQVKMRGITLLGQTPPLPAFQRGHSTWMTLPPVHSTMVQTVLDLQDPPLRRYLMTVSSHGLGQGKRAASMREFGTSCLMIGSAAYVGAGHMFDSHIFGSHVECWLVLTFMFVTAKWILLASRPTYSEQTKLPCMEISQNTSLQASFWDRVKVSVIISGMIYAKGSLSFRQL